MLFAFRLICVHLYHQPNLPLLEQRLSGRSARAFNVLIGNLRLGVICNKALYFDTLVYCILFMRLVLSGVFEFSLTAIFWDEPII